MKASNSDTAKIAGAISQSWPSWAKWVVSGLLLFHVAAVIAGVLAAPPSSKLEQDFAEVFGPYHQAIDQGDSYRYYSTAFPPTPVVTATLAFADGRPEKVVRIPERGLRPRLLHQRQLALAHGLMEEFEETKRAHEEESEMGKHDHDHDHEAEKPTSRWAHSFATHLGKVNPGCKSVTLRLEMHMVPRIERIKEMLDQPRSGPVNLDSEEFIAVPERIGVFPCDAS